jgi:hypothetical protein
MAQEILAIDSYSTPAQVYRLDPADPAAPGAKIGNGFDSGIFNTNADQLRANNCVIRHGTKIYAWHENWIWIYDELNPSADWVQLFNLNIFPWAGGGAISGFYKILIEGEPHLCGIASGSAQTDHQWFSWNLTTNSLRSKGQYANSTIIENTGIKAVGFYKHWIFYTGRDANTISKFNFLTDADDGVTVPGSGFNNNSRGPSFVNWDNELYFIQCSAFSTPPPPGQLTGTTASAWQVHRYDEALDRFDGVLDLGFFYPTSGSFETKSTAWSENGYLYIIFPCRNGPGAGSGDGWLFYRIDKSPTNDVFFDADLTSSLPANVRLPGGVANAPTWNDRERFTAIIDQSNPASPQTTLYYHETGDLPALSLSAYSWNDPNMILIDTGAASNYFIPHELDGGGDKFWTPNDVTPTVDSVQVLGATVRVSFKLHGGGVHNVRLYWALGQAVPTNSGTLTNPSVGSITGGNTMTGVTADGTTVYSVEWRAQFDGIADLDDINFILNPS